MRTLTNFVNYRGRWGVRPGITQFAVLLDLQGTPAAATTVYDVCDVAGYYWAMGVGQEADTTVSTLLWKINKVTGATEATYPKVVWSGYSAGTPIMTVMPGPKSGQVDEAEDRIYMCDFEQSASAPTKYFRTSDNTVQSMSEAFYDEVGGNTNRNCYFSNMLEYNHHLWGTGFLHQRTAAAGTIVNRNEVVRFSQPGLMLFAEPDLIGTDPGPTSEWWINDWRGVGSRAHKIMALGKAGGSMILAQRRATYAIQGFDRYSWGLEQVSGSIGAVGPYAIDWTEDGMAFMWSEVGPVVCNGEKVEKLGKDIQSLVQGSQYAQSTAVAVSPDDNLVYFTLDDGGGSVDTWAAFDYQEGRWCQGSWLKGASTNIVVNGLRRVSDDTLPGPAGAPTSLVETPVGQSQINLAWTNGETGIGTDTQIYKCSGTGCNPEPGGTGTLHDTVGAGVASYPVTGLTNRTIYRFALRHVRNNQNSTYLKSSADQKTWLAVPTGFTADFRAAGVELNWTNVEDQQGAGASDVRIHRRLMPAGSFASIANPDNAGVGAQVYNDDTGDCGSDYEYRIRAEESGWTSSIWTASDDCEACVTPPSFTSQTSTAVVLEDCGDESEATTVGYAAQNVTEGDTVKIYRGINYNGAGYGYTLIHTGALGETGNINDRVPYVYATAAQNDDFPTGNSLTAEDETTEVALAPGGAKDNQYEVNYSVSIGLKADADDPPAVVTIWVYIQDYTSGWQTQASYLYSHSTVSPGTDTRTWDWESKNVIARSGATKLRLLLYSITEEGPVSGPVISVHGFNLGVDADSDYGTVYETLSGGANLKVKYKFEALEGGVDVADTKYSTEEDKTNNASAC
jgi:hypothetical protein